MRPEIVADARYMAPEAGAGIRCRDLLQVWLRSGLAMVRFDWIVSPISGRCRKCWRRWLSRSRASGVFFCVSPAWCWFTYMGL